MIPNKLSRKGLIVSFMRFTVHQNATVVKDCVRMSLEGNHRGAEYKVLEYENLKQCKRFCEE